MVERPGTSGQLIQHAKIFHKAHHSSTAVETWEYLNVGGNTGTGDWCYDAHWANYFHRHIVDADDQNIGTYLLYIQGGSNAASLAAAGLWLSNDYGDTWTKIRSGFLHNFEYHQKLRHVNGVPGAYIYTPGAQDGGLSGPLFKIVVAGGGTGTSAPAVTQYPGVVEPIDIAIGKHMPGKAWPRIWFLGWLNPSDNTTDYSSPEEFGLYYTDDADQADPTWIKAMGANPMNHLDGPICIAASTEVADLAVIGYGGSGFIKISRESVETYTLRLKWT
jgi:hypothetical protein